MSEDLGRQVWHRRGYYKRWLWLIGPITVLLLIAAVFIYMHVKDGTPLDKYASQVAFSMYYPSTLPAGYRLDPKSINIGGGLLVYRLTGSNKQPALVLTEQALPPNFDASKVVGNTSRAMVVPSGTLYDMSTSEQSKHMLTTSSTLIFINAANKMDTTMINALASGMYQVKR